MPYAILLAPASNRVYAGEAGRLQAAELQIILGGQATLAIEPITLAGIGYLQLGVDALSDDQAGAIGRLSGFLALYRREGEALIPMAVPGSALFDDDLLTIPKYPGKTNEQFTRLLLNVTLGSSARSAGELTVLDPICGRGTILSAALTFGHSAAGVDADTKAVELYAAFLRDYLRRKRLKHSLTVHPVRRDGRSLGRRLDLTVTPAGRAQPLTLTVFTGDTRQSAALYGKRKFDAVVADAPYGIVHGSHTDVRGTSGKRDRSAAGLLAEALPVWAGQLKAGGALGLSWNRHGLSREQLVHLARDAGLEPRDEGPYRELDHRVDASIHRDVLVAVRPG